MKDLMLGRRFNYVDLIGNAIAVSLFTQGSFIVGLAFIIIGALISSMLEIKYKIRQMMHDPLWQLYCMQSMKVDAIKLHRLIYNSSLLEAHTAVMAYINAHKRGV